MKVLTQNKQAVINIDNSFCLEIEPGTTAYPQIVAVSSFGLKKVLGLYLPNEIEGILEELLSSSSDIFKMPKSRRFNGGNPLSQRDLDSIAKNFVPSKHSIERMLERGLFEKIPPKEELTSQLRDLIKNSFCAFFNDDNAMCVCVDNTHYFVVQYVCTLKKYNILTYIECSNGTVRDYKKSLLAKNIKSNKKIIKE